MYPTTRSPGAGLQHFAKRCGIPGWPPIISSPNGCSTASGVAALRERGFLGSSCLIGGRTIHSIALTTEPGLRERFPI